VADTGLDESVRNMVSEANILMDGVDILVNCAARPLANKKIHNFGDLTTESFGGEMNVKVMGYIRCAKEVAPIMKRRGWGRIINISGLASRTTGNAVGSMRNVAVSALTKNLADELGPFGINVTVIHPGFTRTEATESFIIERASELGKEPNVVEAELAKNNSVKRIIESADIAYVATMIASPKSIAINGDVIAAGGGVGSSIYY
jgi:NAD(P)-dependent dehydrogenase (short-subunit alcohol dehydrogenase family)